MKICNLCGKEKSEDERTDILFCIECVRKKRREYYAKKTIGKIRKNAINDVCTACGGLNDSYPTHSTCKACMSARAKERYKKHGKFNMEDCPWTFSAWQYCLKCKEIKELALFNHHDRICDECYTAVAEKP